MKIFESTQNSIKAQALLELTVFGMIMIMLLGVLINYGLRYNFQVQAMQEAFRKALGYAADRRDGQPTSVSYMVIKDKHIPSSSGPFGIGSVIPVSALASVTRNWKSQETASEVAELPRLAIDVERGKCPPSHDCPSGGCSPPCTYLIAGFREISSVKEDSIDKYIEIYGQTPEAKACDDFSFKGKCSETEWEWKIWDSQDVDIVKAGVPGTEITDPDSGLVTYTEYTVDRIRVIDSCEGEIMDYDIAIGQCRQITDFEYCRKECEKGKVLGDKRDCSQICGYNIEKPWYCDSVKNINGKYVFAPKSSAGQKKMGLQAGYDKDTVINENKLTKEEGSAGITTTESVNWEDATERKIVLRPFFGDKGSQAAAFNEEVINSVYSPHNKDKTKTMHTKWY